jgi:hypothetical protein
VDPRRGRFPFKGDLAEAVVAEQSVDIGEGVGSRYLFNTPSASPFLGRVASGFSGAKRSLPAGDPQRATHSEDSVGVVGPRLVGKPLEVPVGALARWRRGMNPPDRLNVVNRVIGAPLPRDSDELANHLLIDPPGGPEGGVLSLTILGKLVVAEVMEDAMQLLVVFSR